jgi:2-methylcitrate dehydratase PrpD
VWPAHVRVATVTGETYEEETEYVPGDVRVPFDAAQVKEKFRRFAAPVLGDEGAEAMLALAAAALEPGDASLRLFDAIEQACVRRSL